MSCRTPPQKLAWSFATNMSWDTDRAITRTTASGAKSESGSARPRACHLSPSTPKPATSLRAIKERPGFSAGLFVWAVCVFLSAATLFSQPQPQPPSQAPPPIPGATPNLPPPPGQTTTPLNNRIRSEVDLVVLRATVVGKDGSFVSGL